MNESPSSPEDGADGGGGGGGGGCRRMSETGSSKPRTSKTRSSRDEQHDELRKRMASRKAKTHGNAEDKSQANAAHPYIPSNKPRGERTRVVKKDAHAREHHKPRRAKSSSGDPAAPSAAAPTATAAATPDDLGKSMNLDDLGGSGSNMDHSGMDDSGLSTNSRGERKPRRSRRPPKEGEEPREREHKRRDKPQRHPSRDGEESTDKDSEDGGTSGTVGRRDSMGGASRTGARRRVPGRSKSYDGDHETPPSSGRRVPDRARSGTGSEVSGQSRASREERIAEREERLAAKADGAGRRASRRPTSPGKSPGGDTVTERRRRRKEGDAPTLDTSGNGMADHSEPTHSRRGRRTVDGRAPVRRTRTAEEAGPRRRAGSAELDASIPEDEEAKDDEGSKRNPALRRAHTEEVVPRSPAGPRGPRRDRRTSRRPTNNPATASAAQAWVNAIDSRGGNGSIGVLYGAADDYSDSEEEGDEEGDDALNESGSNLMDETDQSERTGKKSRLKTLLPKSIRSAFGGGKKNHAENTAEESETKDDLDN